MPVVDLRSDTVTKPTEAMRRAMAQAEVGDDVVGEDPTVNRLEEMSAEMMGKEAALFTASGTMSNLLSVLALCGRGDEVVMGSQAHMFWNEVGGASALGGVQIRLVQNDDQGRVDPAEVEAAIRPGGNLHFPSTTLVCLENTHNRCNGGVLSPEEVAPVVRVAHAHGVPVHLDGARIFNAAVALETPVQELTKDVDDVSFCLSKGLSAPVGSLLCGSHEFVEGARKWRKMVGGGMRQAGILAAAGIVALDTMVERLAEDAARARHLAHGLAEVPGLVVDPGRFPTNIVFAELNSSLGPVPEFVSRLGAEGVKVSYPGGPRFRMVTHRHITDSDIDYAIDTIARVASDRTPAGNPGIPR